MAGTLQKYILKELFRTFFPAFLCFEFLVLLGFSVQLIHKGLDVPSLAHVIPYLALYALPHALPTALLTATVMTYGRLSADNEIMAVRTSGMHLHRITTPVIIMSVAFSIITLYLNSEVLPKSYFKVRSLQEKAVKQVLAKHFITAKKKINFHPYQIYISNVEEGVYKDIAVFEYAKDYIVNILLSEEGEIEINSIGTEASLTLRRGEFIRPNIKDKAEAPKMGSFEEATFVIPLRQKVRNTSLKYTTLTNLVIQKEAADNVVKDANEFFQDPDEVYMDTLKDLSRNQGKVGALKRKIENNQIEIKNTEKNISRQDGIIKRAKQDIDIFENYIRAANNNLKRIKKRMREEEIDGDMKTVKALEKSQVRQSEYLKKISLIEKIIEKENRRIKDAGQKILTAENLIQEENEKTAKAQSIIDNSVLIKTRLEKEGLAFTEKVESARMQKLSRELTLNIHKRLSSSFSCLTFILIGIPLGIMTRSSSMLVSLGISFILVLFFYYPLVATGLILADSLKFPVIPSLWGANAFNLILGMVLFRKIFKK